MVAKHYPALLDKVSHTVSPMVATARYIKKRHPGADGRVHRPVHRQKSEVKRYKDAGKVGADYVLTFDELYAMFLAKNIDPKLCVSSDVQQGSNMQELLGDLRGRCVPWCRRCWPRKSTCR